MKTSSFFQKYSPSTDCSPRSWDRGKGLGSGSILNTKPMDTSWWEGKEWMVAGSSLRNGRMLLPSSLIGEALRGQFGAIRFAMSIRPQNTSGHIAGVQEGDQLGIKTWKSGTVKCSLKPRAWQGMVVSTCNLSTLIGWGRRTETSSRPAWAT